MNTTIELCPRPSCINTFLTHIEKFKQSLAEEGVNCFFEFIYSSKGIEVSLACSGGYLLNSKVQEISREFVKVVFSEECNHYAIMVSGTGNTFKDAIFDLANKMQEKNPKISTRFSLKEIKYLDDLWKNRQECANE